jgi:hypothetical protein
MIERIGNMGEEIKNKEIISSTLEKIHSGASISDDEIETTIITMEPIIDLLGSLGPKYFLVWKELLEDINILKSYKKARKGNKYGNNE